MTNQYCDHISREPLKDWGKEGGFWRDRGKPPKVYYCSLTNDLCAFDNEGCFPFSHHILDKSKLERCHSRTLDKKLEKD
jgi:hypothetical protein